MFWNRGKTTSWPVSLATRLTAWYAATAFIIALVAIGSLYFSLQASLRREAHRTLSDRLRDLRLVLRESEQDISALVSEIEEQSSTRRLLPIYYHVATPDGRVIAQSGEFAQITKGVYFPPPRPVEASPAVSEPVMGNGVPLRVTAASFQFGDDRHYVVLAAINIRSQENLLRDYRRWVWIAVLGVLLLSIMFGYQIARRGIRPVHDITLTARRVGSTRLESRIDASHMPPEIAQVATEFNLMLDRLKDSFERLNRFSADIAHELRTPVNSMRAGVELVLSRQRTPAEYRESLESTSEDLDRLVRIIESLLYLARAEDPQHQIRRERLNISRELHIVREFYEISASEAGVQLTVNTPMVIEAEVDRTLFQRAVGNLVQNAIVHTPAGGTVMLSAVQENGQLRVEVADSGSGVAKEHLPHLFDRLYRVDADRSKRLGGAGLGLAIVKSIALSHGGSAEIQSEVGKGTRVTLLLPTSGDRRA